MHRRPRSARAAAGLLLLGALLLLTGVTATPAQAQPQTWPSNAWWYTRLDLQRVWNVSQGTGVTVAVLDVGVQADNGDLRGQVLPGHDFVGRGGDARTDIPSKAGDEHGTYMAQLIAGTGRGDGIVGVAPKAKILPVGVCTARESCSTPAVAQGIRWAVGHGADIINISMGRPNACSPEEQAAIVDAYQHHVLVVVATGNVRGPVSAPANCVGALAIGAEADGFVPWASEASGPELDFVAPGVAMPTPTVDGRWGTSDGTSNATALVSGQLALLEAKYPTDSPRDLVTRMLWHLHNGDTVQGFAKRVNDQLGYGEPLPYFALTEKTDLNAANPIYDKIERWMAKQTSQQKPAPATTTGTTADDDSSSPAGVVVALAAGVVVVLLLVVALVVVLTRRKPTA